MDIGRRGLRYLGVHPLALDQLLINCFDVQTRRLRAELAPRQVRTFIAHPQFYATHPFVQRRQIIYHFNLKNDSFKFFLGGLKLTR